MTDPIHPGQALAAAIADHEGLTKKRLADLIGVPPGRISEVISGKRSITADTALRLSRVFKQPPDHWLNLQKQYELQTAKTALGSQLENIRAYG